MSNSTKFPDALDATVWASRCTAWFGSFKVPDLTEWFQAALSLGFREGQASVYELVDKAQRQQDIFGPARALNTNQFRAWQMMNAAPPAAEDAAPPPKPDWQASFDARDWAKEFMRCNESLLSGHVQVGEEDMVGWFSNALMRGYDEHRWKTEREKPPAGPTLDERIRQLEDRMRDIVFRYQETDMDRAAQADALCNHHERLSKLEGPLWK